VTGLRISAVRPASRGSVLGPLAAALASATALAASPASAADAPTAPRALVRSLSIGSPAWLLAGLVVLVVLALALRAADRRRRRDLARIATPALLGDLTRSLSPRRRAVRRALLLGGIGLAFVALARPELGFTWVESKRRGIDVMIAVDVSRSMLARDVSPDRLTRAKLGVADLLERLQGDRVGLIAFAGSAFLQVPLTLDEGAFRRALTALEPGIIPRGGSDLASAIRIAVRAFRTEKNNFKLLVLLSDGEDLAGDALAAAAEAADAGVKVFTVGVGTAAGELIPDGDKPGRFVEDAGGRIVKSRLDEATLREVAERTGGFYAPLGQRGEGVTAVYEKALAPIPEEELASRMRRVPIDRFQWPLAAAILLLAIEPLVGDRKQRARSAPASRAAAFLPFLLLVPMSLARADGSSTDPEELYRQERYQDSLAGYREAAKADPEDPRRHLNVGAAAYKAGDYGGAAEAFAESLAAPEPPLQSQAFYNLGNAQYRLGEQTQATNPESTKQAWQQAIAAYEEALRVNEKDEDARFNRDFVKKKLEELEKNPPPSPKPSPQPSPQPSSEPSPGEPGGEGSDGEGSQQPSPGDATPPTPPAPSPSGSDSSGGQPTPSPAPQAAPSPAPGGGEPEEDAKEEGSPPEPRPGQMSPTEAEDLLDSLAGDEPSLPALVESGEPPKPEDPERDW
jgi:Ca-activated chloride channel family protein